MRPDSSLATTPACKRRGMESMCTCSLEYALHFVMQMPLMVKKVNMLIPSTRDKCVATCLQKKDCKHAFFMEGAKTCYLYSECPTESLRYASGPGESLVKASGLAGCKDSAGCNYSPLAQLRNDSLCR